MNAPDARPHLPHAEPAPASAARRAPGWQALSQPPPLAPGEVHLWRVRVPDAASVPPNWHAMLAPAERDNVARKRIAMDARRTLTARACLRILLGGYLSRPPASLAFTTTATGKPFLSAIPGTPTVEFNVSHSGDWVVLGFACDTPLGVDVECHRAMEYGDLVNHFFSPAEREGWSAIPPGDQAQAFFAAWTAKEACLKAVGTGLSESLDRFSVSFSRDTPTRLVGFGPGDAGPPCWLIVPIEMGAGYACAVCVGHEPISVHMYTLAVP